MTTQPKCKYCGKPYHKTHNRQEYCSKYCRTQAKKEQNRNNFHKWYHKNKHNLSEKRRYGLGTGTLGQHRHTDPNKEHTVIKNELQRLGIKKIK